MLNFQWIVSKLIDQVYLFIKMYGVKGELFRTYFREMGSFFGFCNTIFCRHLQWISKKFFHKKIQELLNFQQNVTKIIDLVYLFLKITGIKAQLSGSSFMELGSYFFGFCNVFFCIYRVVYLADLSAGFITKTNPKINHFFFFENKIYYCLEIT